MTDADRLQCAIEALAVIESGDGGEAWYAKWVGRPSGCPEWAGGSYGKSLAEHALELIAPEITTWHSHLRKAFDGLGVRQTYEQQQGAIALARHAFSANEKTND